MKAVVFRQHGGPEVLSYEDLADPEPSRGQVLVRVRGVALNHLDLFVRKGWSGLSLKMPHILGSDIAGTISELGPGAQPSFTVGTQVVVDPNVYCGRCEFCLQGQHSLCDDYRIIGEHENGGYAELFAVDSKSVIPIPPEAGLSLTDAASLPLTFMTAWRLLVTKAQVRPGDDVLIIGIGGGLAIAALQVAKLVGARVFVTSSSDDKLKRAERLGADVGINHSKTPDYHKEVWRMTNKRGVDVVVDSAGQATWERSLRSLRKGGRLVTPGATSGPNAPTNISLIFWRQLEVLGSTMGSSAELRDVLKLVWARRLHPVVDRVMPLSQAKTAHEILERGEQFGKIVLTP